jgi:hypothetical protein
MAWSTRKSIQVIQNLRETNSLVLLSSGSLCNVNLLIFRASRYVLWGEIKNLTFEDEKGNFLRNDFGTAKSCNVRNLMAFYSPVGPGIKHLSIKRATVMADGKCPISYSIILA